MPGARFLLFEHGPACAEWSACLKNLIWAEFGEAVVLRHEQPEHGHAVPLATAFHAARQSFGPDLMLLLLGAGEPCDAEALVSVPQVARVGQSLVVVADAEERTILQRFLELGVRDFLLPPLRPLDVRLRLRHLLSAQHREAMEFVRMRKRVGLAQLVGESPALLTQVRKIPLLAECEATVLITGETGTGKELCARALHYLSCRSGQPFVPVNCGAIPVELVENELFGHAAGAFTGAGAAQPGLIRQAEGGTLFLDEVDSLPLAAQVKLLRFLQDKEFRPLGARASERANVRVVAASNARLEAAVKERRLREDLYYRLNILHLALPPLRERPEDIPLLARHFLAHYAAEFGRPAREFAPGALRKLAQHGWPGNVRELENAIAHSVALSRQTILGAGDLDLPVAEEAGLPGESFRQLKARIVQEFERSYLSALLARHHGNIAQAARAAQKNRRAFFQLMRKHRIRVERPPGTGPGGPDKSGCEADKNVHLRPDPAEAAPAPSGPLVGAALCGDPGSRGP